MTKGYTIYSLRTVYTHDDRLRYTLTDMWAIVVTFCCCEAILLLRNADLHNLYLCCGEGREYATCEDNGKKLIYHFHVS
jgi:hypothetical protein